MQSNALPFWLITSLLTSTYAVWWGEAGLGLRVLAYVFLLGTVVCLVLFFVLQHFWPKLLQNSLLAMALFVCWCGAYLLGNNNFGEAYNDCVSQGESVRAALQSYHQAHLTYPANLSALNIDLPGARVLRPNIMKYQTTKAGYNLSFDDLMVEHTATESDPFQAHK